MGPKTCIPGAVWVFLVYLLLLLLCVSPSAGIPTDYSPKAKHIGSIPSPSITTLPPATPRPHCWDPEECCIHPKGSEEFNQCCDEHGCCMIDCPVTMPGSDLILPTKHCHAWKCCVYSEGSPKHQECCKRHGCCPVCERVSSGCCYNGIRYAFRTMVQDLSDVCVQLVCSARLLPIPPYFVATITAVKTCSFSDMTEECLGCPIHHCVDEFGLVHFEGEVWSPTPCLKCECRQGHVLCMSLSGACQLQPPHPGCIVLPGPCCPTYHCEDGCVDEVGIFRPIGSQWPSSDPCQSMTCTETGIETISIACFPSPPPHEGCFLQPVQGQCCQEWNCSRCLDNDGTFHPLHDEWQSDPCIVKVCTTTGIIIRDVFCPMLGPAPHESCFRDITEGGCCEEWKCPGCWEGDFLHPLGSQWPSDDPCFNNECTDDGVTQLRIVCPNFPKPHESCFEYIPDGACCPTWNCSGCLDENGTYHPLYHEWQADQCTKYVCNLDGIITKDFPCPPLGPAPHYTCYTVPVAGGCCKEWKCEGCFDDAGVFHIPGSEWPSSDPCEVMRCMPSGVIRTITVTCNLTLPLHTACSLQSVEGQCCMEWNCSGCWDEEGTFHQLLEEWMSDLCTSHLCTHTGIQTTQAECIPPPRPYPHCMLVLYPGDCCPKWNCKYGLSSSNCYDDEGKEYESGAEWQADVPCMIHRCETGEILTVPLECQSEPPTPNCFKEHPVGECCPTWNCSGCRDDNGVYHQLTQVWKVSPCIMNSCHESGIEEVHLDCPPDEPPKPGCRRWTDPEECCPQWDCSGCEDEDGNQRQNGSEWTSVDQCVLLRCVGSEIQSSPIECSDSDPPLPICFRSTQQGQCCPTWNCSGCMDEAGVFHGLGESWTSFCMSHNCTSRGLFTEVLKCPDSPRPDCVAEPLTADGCCPTWRCEDLVSPDCSAVMCPGPPWNADCKAHTTPGKCCPLYSCSPPHTPPHKPECAGVYCRGPPLNKKCYSYIRPDQCCPFFSCRPSTLPPLKPDCAAVLCRAPPLNNDSCTVTTPPGECCPVYDCNTTINPRRTSGGVGSCTDENGHPREQGEVWISSTDECRKSQCHGGIVIHHYQC